MGILGMGRNGLGVERRWIDVHSVTGTYDKCERKPDDECNRGHPLKIDQRLHPDASDLLEVTGPGYTVDDQDRKSTRLNSSHSQISYAVFCLKKKTTTAQPE